MENRVIQSLTQFNLCQRQNRLSTHSTHTHQSLFPRMPPKPDGDYQLKHSSAGNVIFCLSYIRELDWICAGAWDGIIMVYEAKNPKATSEIFHVKGEDLGQFEGCVNAIDYCTTDKLIYACSDDHLIKSFSWEKGDTKKKSLLPVRKLVGHNKPVRCMIVDNQRNLLYSGSSDSTIRVWRLKSGECCNTLPDHRAPVSAICMGGGFLFTGSWDHTIKAWRLDPHGDRRGIDANKDVIKTLPASYHEEDAICSLAYSDKHDMLVSGSRDGKVRSFKFDGKDFSGPIGKNVRHTGSVASLSACSDGRIFSVNFEKSVAFINDPTASDMAPSGKVELKTECFSCVVFDNNYLLGGEDGKIRWWAGKLE